MSDIEPLAIREGLRIKPQLPAMTSSLAADWQRQFVAPIASSPYALTIESA